MNTMVRLMALGVVGLGLLAGCATPPEPFQYEQSNELKPGPGIFTGEDGVYTIYGPPPKPSGDDAGDSGQKDPAQPDDAADP